MAETNLPPGAFSFISGLLIIGTFALVVISLVKPKPGRAILSIITFSLFIYLIITVVRFIYDL